MEKKKGKSTPLTKRAQRFADAMADPAMESGTHAAIKAGYSPDTSAQAATRLLKNVNVKNHIERRKAEVAKYANVTQAQVLGATALRAFATIDDAFDEHGYFSIEKARKTGAIHLIKKITHTTTQNGENVAVEFYSNESAQDKLGVYLGMERLPQENEKTFEKVLQSYALWFERNPNASVEDKADAIVQFAKGGKVDEQELARRVGVDITIESVQ